MAWMLAICEDNDHDRFQLAATVEQWTQTRNVPLQLETFGHPRNLHGAFHRFDAFMLDIYMPGNKADGWSLAEDIRLTSKTTPIVFITASEDFSLPALNLQHVIGYVKKPFTEAQIFKALDDLHENLRSVEEDFFISQASFHNGNGERYSAIFRIPQSDILFLQSSHRSNYIQINGQEEPQLRQTIKELLKNLPPVFQKADRSLIINFSRVYQLQHDAVVFDDPARTRLNISRKYHSTLVEVYHSYRFKSIVQS